METETTTTEPTPMKSVWKVIGATMIGTLLIGYALHEMRMTTLREQNAREIAAVQENITKLAKYRDELKASTTRAEATHQ
jgi:uncharacterized membrane-anchored protein YhcB (DUF1043 family)